MCLAIRIYTIFNIGLDDDGVDPTWRNIEEELPRGDSPTKEAEPLLPSKTLCG